MRYTLATIVLSSNCAILARGWSGDAHRVIADIAFFNMEIATKDHLVRLTRTSNYDELRDWMRKESTWADDVDHLFPLRGENPKYHFVHTSTSCGPYDETQDCGDKDHPGVCLVTGIEENIRIIVSPRLSDNVQQQSLKYLIHRFGDAHQPLHVGFRADRGGNKIKNVQPYNEDLHNIWDNAMVQADKTFSNKEPWFGRDGYSAMLGRAIDYAFKESTRQWIEGLDFNDKSDIKKFIVSVVEDTSSRLTCKVSYALNSSTQVTSGASLDKTYIQKGASAVSRQMQKAGVRLGKLLNALVDLYEKNRVEMERENAELAAMKRAEKEQEDLATAERRAAKKALVKDEKAARKTLEAEQKKEREERNAMGGEDLLATRIRSAEEAELAARRVQISQRAAEAAAMSKEWAKRRRDSAKADRKAQKLVKKSAETAVVVPQEVETITGTGVTVPTNSRIKSSAKSGNNRVKDAKGKSTQTVATKADSTVEKGNLVNPHENTPAGIIRASY